MEKSQWYLVLGAGYWVLGYRLKTGNNHVSETTDSSFAVGVSKNQKHAGSLRMTVIAKMTVIWMV
jgi:hypothetical protein